MKAYKITPDYNPETGKGLNPCIEIDPGKIEIWLEESEFVEYFLIQIIEISEEEYNNLPEYIGP